MALSGWYVFNKVAAGGNYVTVPNVVDQDIVSATLQLERHGLSLGEPEHMSSNKPRGTVIAQRPPAGSVVRSGRKVYPTVSGADPTAVPDLVGKSLREASDMAQTQGFLLAMNTARVPHSAPRDTILGQDPRPGEKADLSATEIHLLVSDGPAATLQLVPRLVGLRSREVRDALSPLGLKAKESSRPAPDQPFGVVLDQQPAEGTWLPAGGEVTYVVRAPDKVETAPTPQARNLEVIYKPPFSWTDRTLRFEFVPERGPSDFREIVVKGGRVDDILVPFTSYVDRVTVNVYVDGRKLRSYYFEGDNPPVTTDY